MLPVMMSVTFGYIWLFEAAGVQGERLQATENRGVTLLTPPECGKLDYRQRCRLCCCLAPRWRRSLLTAFGANCQGISAEKSCLQVFSAPLDYWQGGNTSKGWKQGSTKPPNPHKAEREPKRGGGRGKKTAAAERHKGQRREDTNAGRHEKRTNPGQAPSRAARGNFAKFLILRQFAVEGCETSQNSNFATIP